MSSSSLPPSIHIFSALREKNTKELDSHSRPKRTKQKSPENMTAPYDFRRDVEIPDDLIARLCAGEKQEKVTF